MTASLPIMTNLAIVSKYYKKDYKFTSMMVGMTTIIGLLTIPIWAYILNYIY
jgi:predicted permease